MGLRIRPSKSHREANIQHIEIYYYWVGFASPPSRVAKWIIENTSKGWQRVDALTAKVDVISNDAIDALETAIALPAVPALNLDQFAPESRADVEDHYGTVTDDDSPMMLVSIQQSGSKHVLLKSESQHGLMLPWAVERGGVKETTFDVAISNAIRGLLPEDSRAFGQLQNDWALRRVELLRARSDSIAADPVKRLKRSERPKQELLDESLLRARTAGRAKELIADGANPNVEDEAGEGLLHKAVHSFDCDFVRFAASQVGSIDKPRIDGMTALHLAAFGGMAQVVRTLIEVGANVNKEMQDGTTPLMAGACWEEIVGDLLKAGADIHALDNEGNATLHYALDETRSHSPDDVLKSIRLLVSAGADTNQRNKAGLSPRQLAAQRSRAAVIEAEVRKEFFGKEDRPAAEARGWKALLAFLEGG